MLPQIVDSLPERFGTYYEPFVGAGSLFFLLKPQEAVIGDSSSELIETFSAVRDNVRAVLRLLREMRPSSEEFYRIRSNRSSEPSTRAAEFIYLNKTCWNGLYRVNLKGQFNVPYGGPDTVAVFDAPNLRACSRALRSTQLVAGDFETTLTNAGDGDLVFLDPPYVTRHNNNGFIDYNEKLFSWRDQQRLAQVARRLVKQGAHVIVANAFHDDLVRLYRGFQVTSMSRASTLAGKSEKRGRVTEALFSSNSRENAGG